MSTAEKKIKLDELKVGMVISQDVIDTRTGEVIVRRGTILDEHSLARMKNFYLSQLSASGDEKGGVLDRLRKERQKLDAKQILMGSIPDLPAEQRESFIEFKNAHEDASEKTKEYIKSIDHGEPVVIDELYELTNGMIKQLKSRSNVFTYINYLKYQDNYTYAHAVNVSLLCNIFAYWLNLNQSDAASLTSAGLLLDIGKTRIDEAILNKKGRLTDDEMHMVQLHTSYGYEMLKNQDISEEIKLAVLQHHERIDGSGYPQGLKNDQISRFGKITGICDVYEAMVSDRPYRAKICPFEVIKDFERNYLGKMDTEHLMIFLKNIAYNYLNRQVLLSDGRQGEIVFINSASYSSPIVRLENGECIDLYGKSLSIKTVL